MINAIRKIIAKPRTVFLIDGCGALLSALLLTVFGLYFSNDFGLSQSVLFILTGIAFVFAIYSFSCYITTAHNNPLFLRIIAAANFLYCCFTAFIVISKASQMPVLGILYFVGEMGVMLLLVFTEIQAIVHFHKTYQRSHN